MISALGAGLALSLFALVMRAQINRRTADLADARKKAVKAMEAAEDAQADLEALEEEKRQLENLSEEDQGAIQGASQKGINVAR